jgi:hypothetical protein
LKKESFFMETTEIGINRTGIATSKGRAEAMLEAAQTFSVVAESDATPVAEVRARYAEESDPVGSVPPPPSIKGAVKAVAGELLGNQPFQLIDKLGERHAFERTGARLYEAILGKLRHEGEFAGGPTIEEIERIVLQEYSHFRLIDSIIRRIGGDPTVVTPSANLHATMSAGILAVAVDPRTTLVQSLEAALLAELTDNEGWETLLELLVEGKETVELEDVQQAVRDESDHLALVRSWLAAAQDRETVPFDL